MATMIWPKMARDVSGDFAWRAAPREDDALLSRAKAGDALAFDALTTRYRARLLNLAFGVLRDHDLAEDAAQDALVRAFERIKSFRGESELSTWLYRITLNECLGRQRRSQRRDKLAPRASSDELQAMTNGATCDDALNRIALERALDQLPEGLRVVLLLRELHGLSYEEIARVLDVPESTVRARLHSARAKFQQAWNRE